MPEAQREPDNAYGENYPTSMHVLRLPGVPRRRSRELQATPSPKAWLSDRRLRQEGESYADELGRMTEAVNRRIPQLRYAPAERVAAGRNTSESQVYGGLM